MRFSLPAQLRSCTMGRMIVIGASTLPLFALLTPRENDDVAYVLSGYCSSLRECVGMHVCVCVCVCPGVSAPVFAGA